MGQNKVIHVWEVQECELTSLMSSEERNLTPIHPSLLASSATNEDRDAAAAVTKKKGKAGNRKDDKSRTTFMCWRLCSPSLINPFAL
ncbi:hypothetical protein K1719_023946 [Acacia pycnantha]|nr:hypothetical protein K1719_023946 [Acacia pycnantha]